MVDQGSEFYFITVLLKKGQKAMTHSRYKVVAERFIRILKNKILNHATAVSKNAYFDVLGDIVDEYNNTDQRTN